MDDKVEAVRAKAREDFTQAAHLAGEALMSLAAALEHFGRSLYAMTWHAYIMAGAPYGETREGLAQWLRERQLIDKE